MKESERERVEERNNFGAEREYAHNRMAADEGVSRLHREYRLLRERARYRTRVIRCARVCVRERLLIHGWLH